MYGICLAITQALRQDSGGERGRRKSRHLPHYNYCGQCPILQTEKWRGKGLWCTECLPGHLYVGAGTGLQDKVPFQRWLDIFSAQL